MGMLFFRKRELEEVKVKPSLFLTADTPDKELDGDDGLQILKFRSTIVPVPELQPVNVNAAAIVNAFESDQNVCGK